HSNLTSNTSYFIPRQSPSQTQTFISGSQTVNQLKAWAKLQSIIELEPSNTSITRITGSINLNDGSNWYSLEKLQKIQQVFAQYLQHFETPNSARRHQHQAIQQQHLVQQSHHHLKPPQTQQSQSQQQQLQTISSLQSPNSLKQLQNPSTNWPNNPNNTFIASPVTSIFNHPKITTNSSSDTSHPTSWNTNNSPTAPTTNQS
ncbi:hypothetical protein O181_042011, partial [Austropuccinia psidii MF-1]|nr:hypothetical protein [Austropuccinia psidii MF-1]